MRLDDFSDELFEVLGDVPGLNVPQPGDIATPPTPYIELPEVTYGQHGAGLNGVTLTMLVAFGQPNNPEVFRDALEYASDEGTRSIPAALLAHQWTTVHTVRAESVRPVLDTVQGHLQLAYEFTLQITGAAP